MTLTPLPKHLVLYADDDPDDIEFVENAFSATTENVELVTAYNGIDALEFLKSLRSLDPDPCLIILDVNMPGMNGKDALMNIRQLPRFSKVPVVLFTTSSLDQDVKFANKYNAGFITKPLDSYQMERITDVFIEHCSDEVRKNIRRRGS
jgi:CheY-like chemotaxis protein